MSEVVESIGGRSFTVDADGARSFKRVFVVEAGDTDAAIEAASDAAIPKLGQPCADFVLPPDRVRLVGEPDVREVDGYYVVKVGFVVEPEPLTCPCIVCAGAHEAGVICPQVQPALWQWLNEENPKPIRFREFL